MKIDFMAPIETLYGRVTGMIDDELKRRGGSPKKGRDVTIVHASIGSGGGGKSNATGVFSGRASSKSMPTKGEGFFWGGSLGAGGLNSQIPFSIAADIGFGSGSGSAGSGVGRSMTDRLSGIAGGSQPAMVKLMSYGSGARMGAMFNYVSREGELGLENELGQIKQGKDSFGDIRENWQEYVSNRRESVDVAVFKAVITPKDEIDTGLSATETARQGVASAFGDRRFAFTAKTLENGSIEVSGLVVLRSEQGERLTADNKAAGIVQDRYDESDASRYARAVFSFGASGNGVDFARAKIETAFGRAENITNDAGNIVVVDEFSKTLTKEWGGVMESRKVRDIMHVMVSSRAGTDVEQFTKAARGFFGEAFAGHKYVFTMHDPASDPKEASEGGKRGHVHAHAIVTMRGSDGSRIAPAIETFRQWREQMAFHARANGIQMEMTDRREFANAPAFKAKDVKPEYEAKPEKPTKHIHVTPASSRRVTAKRLNSATPATTEKSRAYAAKAANSWGEVKAVANGPNVTAFAVEQQSRIVTAQTQITRETSSASSLSYQGGRTMPELNRDQLPKFKQNIQIVIDALDKVDLPDEDRNRRVQNLVAFSESTEALANARDALRVNMNADELKQHDKATDNVNRLEAASESDERTTEQMAAIVKAAAALSAVEREAQSRIRQQLLNENDAKSGSSTGGGTNIEPNERIKAADAKQADVGDDRSERDEAFERSNNVVKLQQERAGRAAQIDKPPEAVDVRSNSSNDDIAKRENDRIESDRIRAEEINRQDRQQDRKNEQNRSREDEENER